MQDKKEVWELLILDGQPGGALVGDIDGDGNQEIISSSKWYRPATFESGIIPDGISLRCVGATTGDVDNDGLMEAIGAVRRDAVTDGGRREYYQLYWYKPGENLSEPWAKHRICPEQIGQPHDLIVTDEDEGKCIFSDNAKAGAISLSITAMSNGLFSLFTRSCRSDFSLAGDSSGTGCPGY